MQKIDPAIVQVVWRQLAASVAQTVPLRGACPTKVIYLLQYPETALHGLRTLPSVSLTRSFLTGVFAFTACFGGKLRYWRT
ncbi:hypothetical protein DSW25_11155 [Sulfitobacter donghicola DSW-25 = KCTC 12864 = JCM 14565]|uniref:Uncharacterized protein n=1 Tax=Sulfitobacter donghicola DSW-25 = KCTC 12864 = JCM 14565 TaxID=1300350 RepID=A0A073IH56_9RHOB|nr:hypothetical protein DSW25_11155 [Sulfitobacter donghicola DSW-25 = KCTC 12864 = JCM 14565]